MLWAVVVSHLLAIQPAPEAPRQGAHVPVEGVHPRDESKDEVPQFDVSPDCTVSINVLHTPGERNKQPVTVSTRQLSVRFSVNQTSEHLVVARQTSAVATIEQVKDEQGADVLAEPRKSARVFREHPGSGFEPSHEVGRPKRLEWSANASLTRAPKRFSVIRGYVEVEVAGSVSIKDLRVEQGSHTADVAPGVTASLNLAQGENNRRRLGAEIVVAAETARTDFAIMQASVLDATDFSVVADKQSSELRVSHAQRSDGSQAYTLRSDRISGTGPVLLRIEVVSDVRVVRIPFEFKDVPGSD